MTTIYGIKNCDTMKKAFAWLDEHGVAYSFHDYKKSGIDSARLHAWSKAIGWKTLINTRGTTWRKLDAATQARVVDAPSAVAVLAQPPSAIKRPVVETGGQLLVGFDEADWRAALSPFLPPFS